MFSAFWLCPVGKAEGFEIPDDSLSQSRRITQRTQASFKKGFGKMEARVAMRDLKLFLISTVFGTDRLLS